jgi:ribosomal protein S7
MIFGTMQTVVVPVQPSKRSPVAYHWQILDASQQTRASGIASSHSLAARAAWLSIKRMSTK